MHRKAKILMNNRSQAVRSPEEFQFNTHDVFMRKKGCDVVLSARPFDWSSYLIEGPVVSPTFMEGVGDLPVQEREPYAAASDITDETNAGCNRLNLACHRLPSD